MLDICRDFGRSPSWWFNLSHGDRVLLLAERRVRAKQ